MSGSTALGHVCPYCGADAVPTTGRHVYPKRPDLASLRFIACTKCDARVGCHRHNGRPLGTLANAELRALRARCHNIFDGIWRAAPERIREYVRRGAYVWLSCELGVQAAHFGHMDEAQARRALAMLHFGPDAPSIALLRELGLQEQEDAEGLSLDEGMGWEWGWE